MTCTSIASVTSPLPKDRVFQHYAWRKRVNKHFPKLAQRVFALRDKSYMGCGFHYSMERQLGRLMACVNDYNKPIEMLDIIMDPMNFREFIRDLVRAEFSNRGWDFPNPQLANLTARETMS